MIRKKMDFQLISIEFLSIFFLFQAHENTHTGAKPHACENCDYRSACLQNLSKHYKQKHGIKKPKPIRMWVHVSELNNSDGPGGSRNDD